jgi:hypothetical protein
MLKIDYILLARHFREETLEEENQMIMAWRNESIINNLTYKRLKIVSVTERLPIEQQKITKEETKVWKKIITKILEEEEEEESVHGEQ